MFSIVLLSLVATIVTGVPVEELKSADYDHYVFTQVYPAGSCYSYFLQVRMELTIRVEMFMCDIASRGRDTNATSLAMRPPGPSMDYGETNQCCVGCGSS